MWGSVTVDIGQIRRRAQFKTAGGQEGLLPGATRVHECPREGAGDHRRPSALADMIASRMIPVIVGVNGIAQRFVGERTHLLHEALGHRRIDLRVDHGDGLIPQDNNAIDDVTKEIDPLGHTLERTISPTRKRIHAFFLTHLILLDRYPG